MWLVLVGDVGGLFLFLSLVHIFLLLQPCQDPSGGWGLGWGAERIWKMNQAFWGRVGKVSGLH